MNTDTRTNTDTTYYDSITTRIPIGRWGDVKEFVGPAVFLASRASSYVSGEILLVKFSVSIKLFLFFLTVSRSMEGGWLAE